MSSAPARRAVRRIAVGATIGALALLGVVAAPMSASAATFSVTNLADSGFGSFRDAVGLANGSAGADIITFDPTFIPINSVLEIDSTITITEDLAIDGSGVSGLTLAPGVAASYVMLFVSPSAAGQSYEFFDFDIDGTAAIAGWSGWAIYSSLGASVPVSVTLDGMVERNLVGPEGPALDVFATNAAGTVTISNSIFEDNTSTASTGGAIHLRGVQGSVDINDTTFEDNTATGDGGAVYIDGTGGGTPSLSVDTVTFRGNESTGGAGGAIASNLIAATSIFDSQFANNTSAATGGAIELVLQNAAATTNIDESQFSQNTAGGAGGAISFSALNGADLDINDTVFDANTAGGSGGGVLLSNFLGAHVSVGASTFSNNVATSVLGTAGGGIAAGPIPANSVLFVEGSTFSNNVVSNIAGAAGTGLSVSAIQNSGLVFVVNSTFHETNPLSLDAIAIAGPDAGGEFVLVSSTVVANGGVRILGNAGTAIISNSIIDGDARNTGADAVTATGDQVGVEYSILSDALNGTMFSIAGNQFSTDPLLGALQNNGGPTFTMLPLTGSPAINTGDPAYTFPVIDDQRGVNRTSLGRIDIGAVELETLALAATGLNISPLVPIGATLVVLVGVGLLLLARRRRSA